MRLPDVVDFLLDMNVTVTDDVANVSGQSLCSNSSIRNILEDVSNDSVNNICGGCG